MKTSKYISALLFISFNLFAQNNLTYPQPGWQDLHGKQIAANLANQYTNSADSCSNNSPAFNCSGIQLRGTDHSSSYFAWDPSPASVTSGGVSFSYLREDSKYTKLAFSYDNGFFIYPKYSKPEGKIDLDVLCSFPIDAASDHRDDAGCGIYTGKSESIQCQLQGITDADGWYNHYVEYGNSHFSQCGFGLTDDYANVTDAFNQTILSMAKISSESINEQNELRIVTWAQGIPDTLPIQAFFYTSSSGLADAQADQTDFYNQTNGMFIPIIQLTLPTSQSSDATFTYNPEVQVKTDSFSVSEIEAIPSIINTSGERTVARLKTKVLSSNGEAISNAKVTWRTTSETGKLALEASYTDASGIAINNFSDTTAENAVVIATGPDGRSYTSRIIPVKQGSEENLYIDSLNTSKTTISVSGQDSATITALVKSKTGGTVAGATVHWATTLGTLSATTSITDDNGAASTRLRSGTPGDAVVTAALDNGSEQSTWIDVVK